MWGGGSGEAGHIKWVMVYRRLLPVPGVLVLACFGPMVFAHDPTTTTITWNREVSRIVYKRCASCHRVGGSAFSLMNYQEARPWAKAIKEEVLERRMPPFAAVKGFGELRDDQSLTQEDLHVLADWVEGGAPEGDDPGLLPKAPDFSKPARPEKKTGTETVVAGSLSLKTPSTFVAVRAKSLADGASIQAVAEKPDGTILPLIWLYNYKSKFDRLYYFRAPLTFPAGTKIQTFPVGAGAVALLAAQ